MITTNNTVIAIARCGISVTVYLNYDGDKYTVAGTGVKYAVPRIARNKNLMNWISVDNDNDLEAFDQSNCWSDSEVVELYALHSNENYFPDDISRTGYNHKNIHILVDACSKQGSHLEIVLIHCDHYNSDYLEDLHFVGRIDALKRIEIINYKNSVRMRCARLIYRWFTLDEPLRGSYFKHSKALS